MRKLSDVVREVRAKRLEEALRMVRTYLAELSRQNLS